MRIFGLIVALALLPTPAATARLFLQTYGATSATAEGCAWNLNQDFFVPRHCDSCRYDLFSSCKTGHTISPACRHLHPVYAGYCTAYGACRYRWRDHVYKVHCGCTPLSLVYGDWHLKKCRKHCMAMRRGTPGCLPHGDDNELYGFDPALADNWLPAVEPLGHESLGTISAWPGPSQNAGGQSAGPAISLPIALPQSGRGSPLQLPPFSN